MVALAGGDAHKHHVRVQNLGAAHLNPGNAGAGRGRHAGRAGRRQFGHHGRSELIHGVGDVGRAGALFHKQRLGGLGSAGGDQTGVHAHGTAGLVHAAVEGVGGPGRVGQAAHGGHVQGAYFARFQKAHHLVVGHHGNAGRAKAFAEHVGKIGLKLRLLGIGMHLERQNENARRGRSRPRVRGKAADAKHRYQREQCENTLYPFSAFAHTVLPT